MVTSPSMQFTLRRKNPQLQIKTTLEDVTRLVPPHDQLIVAGDFNAVSGTDPVGFVQVVGPYGSGVHNDNTLRLLIYCSVLGLSLFCS